MIELITADEAKLSLRLGDVLSVTDDADLALAIAQATAIYLQYHPAEASWTDDTSSPVVITIPDNVKAAVLLILHAIWDGRGDDPTAKAYELMRLNRGPVIA